MVNSRSRSYAVIIVILIAAVPAVVGLVATLKPTGPTAEEFRQVRVGLSRSEVEHLLHGPSGDYRQYPKRSVVCRESWSIDFDCWLLDTEYLMVDFDKNGIVRDVFIDNTMYFGPPSMLQELREWIGL
jgi:hypothetical protein